MFVVNPSTTLVQWSGFVRSLGMKGRRTGHHCGEEPVFIFNIRMYGKTIMVGS